MQTMVFIFFSVGLFVGFLGNFGERIDEVYHWGDHLNSKLWDM